VCPLSKAVDIVGPKLGPTDEKNREHKMMKTKTPGEMEIEQGNSEKKKKKKKRKKTKGLIYISPDSSQARAWWSGISHNLAKHVVSNISIAGQNQMFLQQLPFASPASFDVPPRQSLHWYWLDACTATW
jgi:hypothetical protein